MKAIAVVPGRARQRAPGASSPKPSLSMNPRRPRRARQGAARRRGRHRQGDQRRRVRRARRRATTSWSSATRASARSRRSGPNVTEPAARRLRRRDGAPAGLEHLRPRSALQDMTTDDVYFERGINLRHGYLTEYYVDDAEYIVKVPAGPEGRRRAARADDGGARRASRRPTRSSGGCGCGGRGRPRSWAPARSGCWRRWCCGCAGSR